jgi:hypothetical protein
VRLHPLPQDVAELARAPDEGLLLGDALPATRRAVEPDVPGKLAEALAVGRHRPEPVVEDAAARQLEERLLGEAQPVEQARVRAAAASEQAAAKLLPGDDLDERVHRSGYALGRDAGVPVRRVRRAVVHGVATEDRWEPGAQRGAHGVTRPLAVLGREEDLTARSPVVVA